MAFAFYKREWAHFGKPYEVPVEDRVVVVEIVKFICDNYGVAMPKVTFRGRRWCRCNWKEDRLSYTNRLDWPVGIVAHEIAHYIEKKLSGNYRHNAALLRRIDEVLRIILKKYYPGVELPQARMV